MVGLPLGKIVKADSHIHYMCQIYGKNEVKAGDVPQPQNYALGRFVRINLSNEGGYLVGLVYDTLLLNPDFANLGPRLSPEAELEIFSPDYLNERAVLVKIVAVGYADADGNVYQGVPRFAANTDSEVIEMSSKRIKHFHHTGGNLALAYLPVLIRQSNLLGEDLVRMVLHELGMLLPQHTAEINVLNDELLWRNQVGLLGGKS
jgi:hypothetical protein